MNPRLAARAAAHGGPFLLREALAAGYTEAAIRARCERGVWTRVRHGVYADTALLADPASGHRVRVAAALLALGAPDAVASHESAALMHGIALLTPPREITLTRPSAPGRTRRGVRVHRAALPTGHLTELDGVPVTTPARTVLDLARRLPFRDAVVAADSAMYRLRLSSTDLLWSGYKVIVLLDGMLKYDNAPGQNRKEKLTQERLENDGFIVVRLTWNDVVNHPARSVARIRAALQRAWGCGDQLVSGVGGVEGVRVSRRTARWQRRSSAS